MTQTKLPKITIDFGDKQATYNLAEAFESGASLEQARLINLLINANVFYTVEPWNISQIQQGHPIDNYFQLGDLVYNHWNGSSNEVRLVSTLLEEHEQ